MKSPLTSLLLYIKLSITTCRFNSCEICWALYFLITKRINTTKSKKLTSSIYWTECWYKPIRLPWPAQCRYNSNWHAPESPSTIISTIVQQKSKGALPIINIIWCIWWKIKAKDLLGQFRCESELFFKSRCLVYSAS